MLRKLTFEDMGEASRVLRKSFDKGAVSGLVEEILMPAPVFCATFFGKPGEFRGLVEQHNRDTGVGRGQGRLESLRRGSDDEYTVAGSPADLSRW